MADLNSGKGKFYGVDSTVNYSDTFTGATLVAEKVKKGGTSNVPDGYVVDAIDIDWGGLKLTTIKDGWEKLETISSTGQNAGKCNSLTATDNTTGIKSSGYLLAKISDSFTQIYNQIGGSDSAGLRKRIKDVETSIAAMAGLTPTELTNIQNDLTLIQQELEGTTVNSWTTLVDKLAGLGTSTVKNYVDTAKSSVIGTSSDAATANTIYGVKKYADNAKTTAINSAASDATTKANSAKTAAVNESKQYTDTEIAKLSEDIELAYIGCNQYTDTKIDEIYTTLGAIVDSAMGVRRIEENGEGILEFLNVGNSYSYSYSYSYIG